MADRELPHETPRTEHRAAAEFAKVEAEHSAAAAKTQALANRRIELWRELRDIRAAVVTDSDREGST